ncbi:MAG: anhydro-N-acetylmuramic acid kinase, partial [Chitinophagaceae bacterium]|nr:anhydro-N-acetylmuramic acid kinase [Chitinophagaceae bacterium]
MIYRAIGIMSGSSLDGLDIAFVEFEELRGEWKYEIKAADCIPYNKEWSRRLQEAKSLNAFDYLRLHSMYGKYIGEQINAFIDTHRLHHQVQLIASHGHTVFHAPDKGFTAQLGDGAAMAAVTEINVVSDLRALDVALNGQGAPIVPVGEKLLWKNYDYFLNIGGIANLSVNADKYIAFDTCPANRVLNLLAQDAGYEYDKNGALAAKGNINYELLEQLNALSYYELPAPKSLDNTFGTDIIYPKIKFANVHIEDALCTYVAHIVFQIQKAVMNIAAENISHKKMLV